MPGPVQSATIWSSGAFGTLANGNWTSSITANTSGTAGSENEVARFVPGAAITMKFTAGTKFGPLMLDDEDSSGNNLGQGVCTLAVVRPDGSRKVIFKTAMTSFGSTDNQQDVNNQRSYESTQFCYGSRGEFVVLYIDSGDPIDFDAPENSTNFPYTYKLGY